MAERIEDVNLLENWKENMIIYSIETNRLRVVPDVKDGLKFVQRRILYSASTLGALDGFLKTAEVVGDVIGKYHPHGDSSVADAITPMCNWYSNKIPYLYSESNMGSMQGDGAAHQRYTEIALSSFADDAIFKDFKGCKDIIDWVPTFNNKRKEPEYLPMAGPMLLVNGVSGIGTGMVTGIPSHNLGEVIDATIKVIEDPTAPVVLVPDHCMPVEIIDTNWKAICNKGIGSYTARSIIDVEHWTKPEHDVLVIKSVPDSVYFDKGNSNNGGVIYSIMKLVSDGKLPQITKYDEDSHGNNMRILLHLKPGSDPNYVKGVLYKETQLQKSYPVRFEVLDGIHPLHLSYKAYIEYFIEHRKTTKFRQYCIRLQQVRTDLHQLDAYVKTIESGQVDNIIKMIRKKTATDDNELIEYLVRTCNLTDLQAKFIINTSIKQLSKSYLMKYKEKIKKYTELDKEYYAKITNEQLILKDIVDELLYLKQKYGTPRKSRIVKKEDINAIPAGDFKIVITENNYIKKVSPADYVGAFHGDNPKFIINVENRENILLFSMQGKVFKLPVHKIPITERNSLGTDIRMILKGLTSDIAAVMYEPTLVKVSKMINKYCIVTVTAGNCIKKLSIEDFLSVPPSGIFFTKLNPGDFVREVHVIPDHIDIVIYSNRRALRVNMEQIPNYRRSTLGVAAMKIHEGEVIDGISAIYLDSTDIVVITEQGKANRFNVAGLPVSDRNKAGSSVIKLAKGDRIHSIFSLNSNNVIKVITKNGKIELPVSDIPMGSSISTGTKFTQGKDIVIKCSIAK